MALRLLPLCIALTRVGAQIGGSIPPACKPLTEKPEFKAEISKLGPSSRADMEKIDECADAIKPQMKTLLNHGQVCDGALNREAGCSMPDCIAKIREMTTKTMSLCWESSFPKLAELNECAAKHMCDGVSIAAMMAIAFRPQFVEMLIPASLDNKHGMLMTPVAGVAGAGAADAKLCDKEKFLAILSTMDPETQASCAAAMKPGFDRGKDCLCYSAAAKEGLEIDCRWSPGDHHTLSDESDKCMSSVAYVAELLRRSPNVACACGAVAGALATIVAYVLRANRQTVQQPALLA